MSKAQAINRAWEQYPRIAPELVAELVSAGWDAAKTDTTDTPTEGRQVTDDMINRADAAYWAHTSPNTRDGMHAALAAAFNRAAPSGRDCTDHRPTQHRDGKPPWCHQCGSTADFTVPTSRIFPTLPAGGEGDD